MRRRPFLFALSLTLFLTATTPQSASGQYALFSQYQEDSQFDLASQPENNDRTGSSLASGDFNNDGYDDLVIGCPFEDYSTLTDSGWVSVLYGGPDGADGRVEDLWDQQGDVEGGEEPGDQVGFSVAVGDFNDDGYDDLVMGSPKENIGDVTDSGAINVIYGSNDGLQHAGNRMFYQSLNIDGHAIIGTNETFDNFGYSLAVGDFNDDGRDDLALGAPFEDIGSVSDAGAIWILYGRSVVGLHPEDNVSINRSTSGILGVPTASDYFGRALAAGDFDGDGYSDLAAGMDGSDEGASGAGAVSVIYGSASGLDTSTNELWHLNSTGIPGDAAAGDSLGRALTSGNFDGDLYDDLAIGIPERDFESSIFGHGAALLIYGTAAGLDSARSIFMQQGSGGLPGILEKDDGFGEALAAGDMNGDGADELLIGIPGDTVFVGAASRDGAGSALLIQGGLGTGIVLAENEAIDYNVVGNAATGDGFAAHVAFGDFNGNGLADAVLAIPRRAVNDASSALISDAGEILVRKASEILFSDGFESGDLSAWSSP